MNALDPDAENTTMIYGGRTFDHFVLCNGEQIGMAVTDANFTNCIDVPGQGELEYTRSEVEDLDGSDENSKLQVLNEGKGTYRSAEPVANHSLLGSTAMQRTQPIWPLMTCECCGEGGMAIVSVQGVKTTKTPFPFPKWADRIHRGKF